MGRQNYMTITVADTIQDMFNEFVTIKGTTKTAALNDVLEMYMLAKDEDLYLKLKKKYLNVEGVISMIADRDTIAEGNTNEFLFMKLSSATTIGGNQLDGEGTIRVYIKDEKLHGYTWFSTESLYYGMSKDKVKYYNKKIDEGNNVRILFAINNQNCDNDIAFSADVLEIYSDKMPVSCPGSGYPVEFGDDEKAKIWIKLKNIKEEDTINASMLKIITTGRDLKQTITNAQYHFGYVTFK
ncbi:hypothetical protein AB8U03_14765 [Clostridium sp. Mt-5]|uniref:Uncharacterized protein n=1 Tax=Clostridium moutaii TaxID=3240932 RepID=A0ABV4BUP4_9CLOT